MNYPRRRFINIASIGFVSSAINHKIIPVNEIMKHEQHFATGNHHLFHQSSSFVEIDGKTYRA